MVWHVVKLSETDYIVKIGFSCEKDKSLDGIIVYEKENEKFIIEKLSKSSSEFDAKRTVGMLWHIINTDKLSNKPYRICSG